MTDERLSRPSERHDCGARGRALHDPPCPACEAEKSPPHAPRSAVKRTHDSLPRLRLLLPWLAPEMTETPKFEYTVAIQTRYNGRHFRSRLEARWAVFFDALGISYFYEPDGFALPSGDRYQPDFYLPHVHLRGWGGPGVYIEVKPTYDAVAVVHGTLSEFGCGFRDFKSGGPLPSQLIDRHPNEHNLIVLVGEVGIRGAGYEGYMQYGPWFDIGMAWHRCDECRAVKIDFEGGSYDECPVCKSHCWTNNKDLPLAVEQALSMRFDRQGGARR